MKANLRRFGDPRSVVCAAVHRLEEQWLKGGVGDVVSDCLERVSVQEESDCVGRFPGMWDK